MRALQHSMLNLCNCATSKSVMGTRSTYASWNSQWSLDYTPMSLTMKTLFKGFTAKSPQASRQPNRESSRLYQTSTVTCTAAQRSPHAPNSDVKSSRSSFLRLCFLTSIGAVAQVRSGSMLAHAASQSSIEKVLDDPKWPKQLPYGPDDFRRFDESPDTEFYSVPRFVTHIDDGAIGALRKYYSEVFPPSGTKDAAILDICSSWISHYPQGYKLDRIAGLGINQEELERNSVLTDYGVEDLNKNPKLPYDDNTFDVITNAVSVDYLVKPLEIFKEMHRCLKPGGLATMSFSNRCFPTKAISIWTSTGDPEHVWIVGSYFHYSVPGGFDEPKCRDISPKGGFFGQGDPMYVVYARKL